MTTPERCGQRLIVNPPGGTYTCALAADHRGEFHRSEDGSTWRNAGDFLRSGEPAVPAVGENSIWQQGVRTA